MELNGHRVLAVVVSARRPHQVPRITELCGWAEPLLWVVPAGQESDYLFQGAKRVHGVHGELPNICGSRNQVLDYAFKEFDHGGYDAVVMLDDDTKSMRYVHHYEGTSAWTRSETLPFVVDHVLKSMDQQPEAKLAGIAPTSSWLFVSSGPRIKTRAFIQSNFVLVKRTDLRYDESLELSEDYDYCIQHIARYGAIVRDDLILGDYQKRTNAGGLQDVDDREAADIASRERLYTKWPEYVTWPDPKHGPREVRVNWKAIHGSGA